MLQGPTVEPKALGFNALRGMQKKALSYHKSSLALPTLLSHNLIRGHPAWESVSLNYSEVCGLVCPQTCTIEIICWENTEFGRGALRCSLRGRKWGSIEERFITWLLCPQSISAHLTVSVFLCQSPKSGFFCMIPHRISSKPATVLKVAPLNWKWLILSYILI